MAGIRTGTSHFVTDYRAWGQAAAVRVELVVLAYETGLVRPGDRTGA